jgi:hypothetical protein
LGTGGNNINTARNNFSRCWYTNSSFKAFGGQPQFQSKTGATEEYDGTSWTNNPNPLNTSKKIGIAGAGTQTAALAFGGSYSTCYSSNRRI